MELHKKFILEVIVKNLIVFFTWGWFVVPWVMDSQKELPVELQSPVLSVVGLLMAASIIGAFEMSYKRTNLVKITHRYLAHAIKAILYIAIGLLMMIGLGAMSRTPGFFNDPIAIATMLITLSLILYDFWDALCAGEEYKKGIMNA